MTAIREGLTGALLATTSSFSLSLTTLLSLSQEALIPTKVAAEFVSNRAHDSTVVEGSMANDLALEMRSWVERMGRPDSTVLGLRPRGYDEAERTLILARKREEEIQ